MYGTIAITVVPPKLMHKTHPLELPLTQVYGKGYFLYFHLFSSKATQKNCFTALHQTAALCKNKEFFASFSKLLFLYNISNNMY